MNAIRVACVGLLLLAGACHREDTGAAGVWGRTVEPRLSTTRSWHSCTPRLSPGHAVIDAQCAAAPLLRGRCNEVISSRAEADAMLVAQPQCTDVAIARLKTFSRNDSLAMNDLAAAYYVRAQRNDAPADLLMAFDAAQIAVAVRPRPAGAEFNLALVLEALSLRNDAIDAWGRAEADERGKWAEEARVHRDALLHATVENGEQQWARVRGQIDSAIAAGDLRGAERLVAQFPASSEAYFEDDVLAQWAHAPSSRNAARVKTFAAALSTFFHDRYFDDVAAAIVNARPPAALAQAHLCFADARASEAAMKFNDAAPLYARAAALLDAASCPQALLARIAHAGQEALRTDKYDPALQELDSVAAEASQYPSVMARVELKRLFADQFSNRYNDYFTAYDAAKAAYARMGDWEDGAAVAAHGIATMSVVGLKEAAWREAFLAMRDQSRVPQFRTRYPLVGAIAKAALDLQHPEVALRIQNLIVDEARRQPSSAYLVSALDHLAAIEATLGHYTDAQRHLDDAARANSKDTNASLRRALQARLDEVEGLAVLKIDPRRAVAPLTRAIDDAANGEFTSYSALLFAERAQAYRDMHQDAAAEADVREALRRLHAEEEAMLSGRHPGSADDLWNSYFSRFEDTYDLLIRHLMNGRGDEAFRVAERARAYEPLDLVRKLPSAPPAFRELAADVDHLDIAKLRALLPPSTFLVEYRVLDDTTFAWILSRDIFEVRSLPARRSDVKRWTAALQDAARFNDGKAFDANLEAPYDNLLRIPLDVIHGAPGGTNASIVIVPDRELRGLPFAALRNPDTKRYLIEDHAVAMSGSALLYVFAVLRDRALASHDAEALLIGDPAFNPESTLLRGLGRLPFARSEIDHIRGFYPHSTVLMDEAATADALLQRAPDSSIVHIAAHGIVNGDAPSQSFLVFRQVLTAQTLMRAFHTDKTRLVVLGACSSAGGLPVGAEGIAPLVRPIVGAGVPGVIGALWDIDDATAARLMVSFHRHYLQGRDAAEALREAQLEMLRSSNPGEQSGLSWAPFQAIGHASSPFALVGDITKEKPP